MIGIVLFVLFTHAAVLACGYAIGYRERGRARHAAPATYPEKVAARPPPIPKRTGRCGCGLSFLIESVPAIHLCGGCGRRTTVVASKRSLPLPAPDDGGAAA